MSSRHARHGELICLLLVLAVGLGLVFHRQIGSAFALMQTDPGDTRHLNYVLEHNHLSLFGDVGGGNRPRVNLSVWDSELFHPTTNAAAYTETLLSLTFLYSVFRAGGFLPDTAFQLWTMLLAVLNYLAAYALLRRAFSFSLAASCVGAFLFAFGAPRTAQLGHAHLIGHFFTVGALFSLARIFGNGSARRGFPELSWVWSFWAFVVAQVYAGIYLAWFFLFSLLVAAIFAVAVPTLRSCAADRARRLWPHWLAGGLAAGGALIPLAGHYLMVADVVGYRDFETVRLMLPRPQAWLNSGPYSWIHSWIWEWPRIHRMSFEWEQRLSLGIVTWGVVLWGLWRGRRRRLVAVLLLTTATVVLLASRWPGGFTLWSVVFESIPGAKAIRAVSRVGILVLVPAMVGVALAWEDLWRRKRWGRLLAVALALVVAVEQGQSLPAYSKAESRRKTLALAAAIPEHCTAFYYSPVNPTQPVWETQLDAMWSGLMAGIPTINGYSSNLPPGWSPLLDHSLTEDRGKEDAIRSALLVWVEENGLSGEICWVKLGETRLEVERLRPIGVDEAGSESRARRP